MTNLTNKLQTIFLSVLYMFFDKLNTYFIHIPKNAGTSIEQTLLQTYYNSELILYKQVASDTIFTPLKI
jgi:hypothetical protein